MTIEGAAVKHLVTQLQVAEEEVPIQRRFRAECVEPLWKRQLRRTDQALVPGREGIDVAENAMEARRVVLEGEPAFDLMQPPRAQQACRVGLFRFCIGDVRVLPLAGGNELLRLEEQRQAQWAAGQCRAWERTGERTQRVPDREQDLVGERVAERGPGGE